jgi:hypothetical protein
VAIDPTWKDHLKIFRGNLSLWALGLSVLIFKGWQWYFEYPVDTEVAILGGILRLKVSYLTSVITFVFGWLVGIYSLKNLQKVMIHFFRPLGLVNDTETQDFFTAPATMLFSIALLAFVLDVASANITHKVMSRYEVFVELPRGNGTFLVLPDGKTAERTSLKPGQAVRIALRGRDDSQVLLIRDQYNLITLDALNFSRANLRSKIESRSLVDTNQSQLGQVTIYGRRETGLFETEITGPLRYSQTKVDVTITPLGRSVKRGGWVRPGTGSDCPERSGPAYSRKFFQSLCDNRSLFSIWETIPAYHESIEGAESTVVYHSIGQYDVTVRFERSSVKIPGDRFETREAKEVIAVEKEVK